MQVLLRSDVAKLGKRGDIVAVKGGYARNFLLPTGMAIAMRGADLKVVAAERERLKKIVEKERLELRGFAEKFVDASVTIISKANEEGHLFGSVTEDHVAAALTAEVAPVEPSAVRLEEHIKSLGVYDVPIHIGPDIEDVIAKVWVVGE